MAGTQALPQKISEVKGWLEAHADIDPAVLGPYPKQKAAARRASMRALGLLATPAALDALSKYAQEDYPDAELEELHRMWSSFDRREFAAKMFLPGSYRLNLGVTKSLEGIEAVGGLTGIDAIFTGETDLDSLAECVELRRVKILCNVKQGVKSVEPLTKLPALIALDISGTTRSAHLELLAGTATEKLSISLDGGDGSFLLEMPKLHTLVLAGGTTAEEDMSAPESWAPEPIAAHPGLAKVVLELVSRGVNVVVNAYEKHWVNALMEQVEDRGDIYFERVSGRFGLANDEASLAKLSRAIYLNTIAI